MGISEVRDRVCQGGYLDECLRTRFEMNWKLRLLETERVCTLENWDN